MIIYIEPTEKQKFAFFQKLRRTYSNCFLNKANAAHFEECKVCKDHLNAYLKPLKEDIQNGYHLREDVVKYIADFCGIDEQMAAKFLISIGDEDDIIIELCKYMSPCQLTQKTKGYPSDKQKKEFKHKMKQGTSFEDCFDCKRKLSQRLNQIAPKPFIINDNVKNETKKFTNVPENWIFGAEDKQEYIQRVCGIMGSCKS